MAYENFNAASAEFTIKGVNVHPGEAKDIMVNAALVGCEIAAALPANETPATTEGREGFYHLCDMSGDVASAHLSYIVRDHDKAAIEENGLEPLSRPVRGGTDGARLSFMGLPCPNLGTGGYGFHGPFEHISVEGMETAVNIIKSIVKHVLMLADA